MTSGYFNDRDAQGEQHTQEWANPQGGTWGAEPPGPSGAPGGPAGPNAQGPGSVAPGPHPQQGSFEGAPYGDPAAAGPRYQGPYDQGTYPAPGPYGAAPPKRRTGLVVAAAIGGVVVLGGAAALAGSMLSGEEKHATPPAGPPAVHRQPSAPAAAEPARTLSVPKAVPGYQPMKGSLARGIIAQMRKEMTSGKGGDRSMAKAKIGLYAKPGQQARPLIFVGMVFREMPDINAEVKDRGAAGNLDEMMTGAGVRHAKDYPPGPLGGVLRCGQEAKASEPTTVCGWTDRSTAALVFRPGRGQAELARTTLAIRGAAEH